MPIAVDTHVHLYDCYDLRRFLDAAFSHLGAVRSGTSAGADPSPQPILCLSERSDCHAFRAIASGETALPDGYLVEATDDPAAVRIVRDGTALLVLAGRQIVTRERLEVLALTADLDLADGHPAREVVHRVLEEGALPVLAWAPGKWWFRRGAVVRELLEAFPPSQLILGDSSLRVRGWGEPRLMRSARAGGYAVVAGSDPLPFPGEERRVGTYVTHHPGSLDPDRAATSFRCLLREDAQRLERSGRRAAPVEWLLRMKGNRDARRRNR